MSLTLATNMVDNTDDNNEDDIGGNISRNMVDNTEIILAFTPVIILIIMFTKG